MDLSIVFHSETGTTRRAAEMIAAGAREIPGTAVHLLDLNTLTAADEETISGSAAVIFGTPTYVANLSWQIKRFFDENWKVKLGGKLGAAYATENSPNGGGGEVAIMTLVSQMMVRGMLCYSSGTEQGRPFIHIGPTIVRSQLSEKEGLCRLFGARIAKKAHELFDKK